MPERRPIGGGITKGRRDRLTQEQSWFFVLRSVQLSHKTIKSCVPGINFIDGQRATSELTCRHGTWSHMRMDDTTTKKNYLSNLSLSDHVRF